MLPLQFNFMSLAHKHYLQQAIDLASQNVSSLQGGPYGAVIVKDARVIAASGNCVTINKDPTAHAEIMAIRQACIALDNFQLKGCTLYTSCEPCPMCLGAIYWARLEKVYFACNRQQAAKAGFDDGFIYDEISKDIDQRQIPMRQIDLTNAEKPFLDWNRQNNKVCY